MQAMLTLFAHYGTYSLVGVYRLVLYYFHLHRQGHGVHNSSQLRASSWGYLSSMWTLVIFHAHTHEHEDSEKLIGSTEGGTTPDPKG